VFKLKKNENEYLYIDGQHYDSMVRSRKLYNRVQFFVKQVKKYGDSVLELACGTGEIAIPIAKAGMSVMGIDFSEKMLAQAMRKSKEKSLVIDWIKLDMINFSLNKKFTSIIMPGAAMNWILNYKDIESCLSCVKTHLTQNGRFIFDVFNPNLEILLRNPSQTYPMYEYPDPHGEGTVVVSGSNSYDKVTQISHFISYYKIDNKEIIKKIKLRMFFPQELDALLHYNELIIDHKYGTFNEGPFSSDSNHQIIICHKN